MAKDDKHERGRERLEKALKLDREHMSDADRRAFLDRLYDERTQPPQTGGEGGAK